MVGLVNRKACVIVLIIFVRLSSGTSLEDSSVIENLQNISDSDGIFSFVKRHICHKIRFCTSEPNTPSEDSSSDCCEQCSCAANCFEFGNCCPDVINVIEQNLTVSCKNFDEIYLVNETYKDLWPQLASDQRYLQSYYIIDSCFQGNFTELDDPCSVETVNDLAPVMDVENNILYKNRKCASCNGAENVIDLNVQQRSCFSEAFAYRSPVAIVKEFYRTCEPVILPSMDINWHFECYENLAMISQCRYVGRARYYDWGENYDRLEELCQNDSLIFPMYTASASYYKNPFCFLCNLYFDDVPGQITTQISSCANPSNTRSSTGDITNGNVFPRSRTLIGIKSSTQPCDSDDMIFNPDLGRCQELRCPIYHAPNQGTCQRYLNVDASFLKYELLFNVASQGSTGIVLDRSNSGLFIDTATNFLESNLDCDIDSLSLQENDTLSVVLSTTPTCNDDDIISFFRVIFTFNSFRIDIQGKDNTTISFVLSFLYDWGNQGYPYQSNGVFGDPNNPIITVQMNHFMFYCEHIGFSENDLAALGLSNELVEERFVNQEGRNELDSFEEKYFICIEEYIQLPTSDSDSLAAPMKNLTGNTAHWVTASRTGSLSLVVLTLIVP